MKYDIGLFLKGFLGICLKAFKIIEIKNKQRNKERTGDAFFRHVSPGVMNMHWGRPCKVVSGD